MTQQYQCTLPFAGITRIHLDTKKITPCCHIQVEPFTGDTLTARHIQLREDMINNKKSPLCKKCWDIEDNNGLSPRIADSEGELDWTVLDIYQPVEKVEIKFTNKCQMMCVYCSPAYSSMWQDQQENFIIPIQPYIPDRLAVDNALDVLNMKTIIVTGGEPMMEPVAIDFLMNLDFDETRKLMMVTNLSYGQKVFESLIAIINKHPNMHILCSLDAAGENLSRKYLNWSLWDKNYKLLVENLQTRLEFKESPRIKVLITVNLLNYDRLEELIIYLTDYREKGYINTDFAINYVGMDQKFSLKSGIIDRTKVVHLTDKVARYLTKIELESIIHFNNIIETIQIDEQLAAETSAFLKRYDEI
jgi:organic radical activating enzyme